MESSLKNLTQRIVRTLGITIHRTDGRGTLGGALKHLKGKDFDIQYVIDGGASDGRWTHVAQKYFPNANYTLVEPLKEYTQALEHIPRSHITVAALAETEGEQTFYLGGAFNSSLVERPESETRVVPTVTLDSLITEPEKTLVKLDLEGGEYAVLRSSQKLPHLAAIIMECTFSNLPKYCAYMQERGMSVYEIYDLNFDRNTHDMSQVDIVFVPKLK